MRHLYNPLVPVSIFLVLLVSCGEWFLPPLEVVSIAAEQNVQIVFSASPSPESIKKAFTMTEDSQTLSGDFSFNGKKVIFSPVNGIRINREYTITLSTVAEDQKGNSLLKEYIYRFNTKDTTGAPYIVSITPANESNIITQPEKITIVFSKAVNTDSFTTALHITPSMNYVLEWNSNNTTVSVIPVKPLSEGTRYIIAINTSLSDTYRNTLLNAFSSTFLYGLDTTPPMLSLAWETPIGSTGLLDENVINGNIPLESEIILSFNKKCIVDSIAGFIELTPSISFTTIPDLVSQDKVRLLFPKKPDWNKTYTLKIRKNITDTLGNRIENDQLFPLLFNNEKDRPITYINGWFDNNGSLVPINQNNDYGTLTLDSLYFPPLGSTVPTKLFYAFAISSQATSLSLVSAMQAISISPANSCAFVSIRTMRIWSQTEYETSTLYSLIDNSNSPHIIILETGIEIENTDKNGFLTFTIRKDIADTLHNTMQDNLTFTLNKQ